MNNDQIRKIIKKSLSSIKSIYSPATTHGLWEEMGDRLVGMICHRLQESRRWIPVGEREPSQGEGEYLVIDDGVKRLGRWYIGRWMAKYGRVTHFIDERIEGPNEK